MISRRVNFSLRRRGRGLLLLAMVAGALLIVACGKKGPLYLPKEASAVGPYTQVICPGPPQSGNN